MHEFKITIKLADRDYCNGCACLDYEFRNFVRSYNYKCKLQHPLTSLLLSEPQDVIRPDICKANDKEVSNG